jgi:hypothetical protein
VGTGISGKLLALRHHPKDAAGGDDLDVHEI